jgi:hypothetical protein
MINILFLLTKKHLDGKLPEDFHAKSSGYPPCIPLHPRERLACIPGKPFPRMLGLLFSCNEITLKEGYLIAENKSDAAPRRDAVPASSATFIGCSPCMEIFRGKASRKISMQAPPTLPFREVG